MTQEPGYFVPVPPGHPGGPYRWHVPPPAPLSPGGVPLADFGTRLLAYMIDIALLTAGTVVVAAPVVAVLIFQVLPEPGTVTAGFDPFDVVLPVLLIEAGLLNVVLLGYYLYAVEYMHRTGQTLGKRLMRIRVVPIDPARRLTRGMAVKRYLVEFVAGSFVPFLHYVDCFWPLWDKPYQQTLHDKVAKTVVVKVSP